MKYIFALLSLFAFLTFFDPNCLALQCNEDNIGPDAEGYTLKNCEEGTKFCAVLSNIKTKETFRACALEKMCQTEGPFDYQQHPELHIDCCSGDGCNEAFSTSIGFGVLVASSVFSILFQFY